MRTRSLDVLAQIGLDDPLVPIVDVLFVRPVEEVEVRALVFHALVAASRGLPPATASAWLHAADLGGHLSPSERAALAGQPSHDELLGYRYADHVETVWTFAWILGLHSRLDARYAAGTDLVAMLPDLRFPQSWVAWRPRIHMRGRDELEAELDLYTCLTWHVRTGASHPLINAAGPGWWCRRAALTFATSDVGWADLDLG